MWKDEATGVVRVESKMERLARGCRRVVSRDKVKHIDAD